MVDTTSRVSRSDGLLGAIALPLGLAVLVGAFPTIPMSLALGVGGVPAGAGVWYALFREPVVRP